MANYLTSTADLISVANAIRSKFGLSESLRYPEEFINLPWQDTIVDLSTIQLVDGTLSGTLVGSLSSYFAYAFADCSLITYASFPNCTVIASNMFNGCTALTGISFPKCITISAFAFNYCSNLTNVSFSQVTDVPYYCFYSCTNLSIVSLPQCTTIGDYVFMYCSSLTTLSFPKLTKFSGYNKCFYGCSNLYSLYLLGSNYVELLGGVFANCPLDSSGTGKIYVPASMLATYKTMPYWSSYYSNKLVGV